MEEAIRLTSDSSERTELLAEEVGRRLQGGEIIELIGDVGAGKTTFVRGLARGIGSVDRVSSPTFTVSKIYHSKKIELHHYDFYRLDDLAIIQNELAEVIQDPENAVVLEWAEEVQKVLSPNHIRIKIDTVDETTRVLTFGIPEKYKYIRIEK